MCGGNDSWHPDWEVPPSLSTLYQHMQGKTYKERAHDAVKVTGLNLPDSLVHMTAPTLCNPKQTNETKGVVLPLGDMHCIPELIV